MLITSNLRQPYRKHSNGVEKIPPFFLLLGEKHGKIVALNVSIKL
jgi:hypothetical protein